MPTLLTVIFPLLVGCLGVLNLAAADPSSAELRDHLGKATAYLRANDADSAAREFQAALALDPHNAEANANLGVIAFFHRDYATASEFLRKALAADPSLAKSEALLGICERRLGQPGAQALLEKSFPLLKDKNLQIQTGLELANTYYQQDRFDRAAAVIATLVDLDPDNVEILYMAHRTYSELADDTLNKLAILAPDSARMQQIIAERLVNDGDLKDAIIHYRKCLEINPHIPGVRYELAEAILDSAPTDPANQSEAKTELETALKLEGESSKAECELAKIALRQSDTPSAMYHFQRAYKLNPQDEDAQLGLGRLLMSSGHSRDALRYLQMAVEADPLNTEAHYRLARVYNDLNMPEEAQKQTKLFREIKQAQEQMKRLYLEMNRHPKADPDSSGDGQP